MQFFEGEKEVSQIAADPVERPTCNGAEPPPSCICHQAVQSGRRWIWIRTAHRVTVLEVFVLRRVPS